VHVSLLGGNLFILYGSHIGISDAYKLGMFSRAGQLHNGTACGAAVGSYNYCCNPANVIPDAENLGSHPSDYQMQYLISEINKVKSVIDAQEGNMRQAEIAKQTFRISNVSSHSCMYSDTVHITINIIIYVTYIILNYASIY
jgi:hypothetical protein